MNAVTADVHSPSRARPLTSIITVNYNGRRFLTDLLDSLQLQTYEAKEIILVDNGSTDGSREFVQSHYPQVRVLAAARNLGFAAGCNYGTRAAAGDLIALINNDTVADPGWLEYLVDELLAHPDAAAVGSKIVFLKPFIAVGLRSRDGVLVDVHSRFADCAYVKAFFRSGWGRSAEAEALRPAAAHAELWLPVERADASGRLRLGLAAKERDGTRCVVELSGTVVADLKVDHRLRHFEVDVPASTIAAGAFEVINNAGSRLDERGNASDRGFGERDLGQYEVAENVQALCACAMLARRDVLERTRGFDESFFMYYEDTDLSWRMRKLGHSLRYQPKSIVRHVHTGSTVEWSPFFLFHVARNRVLISLKNSPAYFAGVPLISELARLFHCLRRCATALLLRGRIPEELASELRTRLRVQASLVFLVPRVLADRWRSS